MHYLRCLIYRCYSHVLLNDLCEITAISLQIDTSGYTVKRIRNFITFSLSESQLFCTCLLLNSFYLRFFVFGFYSRKRFDTILSVLLWKRIVNLFTSFVSTLVEHRFHKLCFTEESQQFSISLCMTNVRRGVASFTQIRTCVLEKLVDFLFQVKVICNVVTWSCILHFFIVLWKVSPENSPRLRVRTPSKSHAAPLVRKTESCRKADKQRTTDGE